MKHNIQLTPEQVVEVKQALWAIENAEKENKKKVLVKK